MSIEQLNLQPGILSQNQCGHVKLAMIKEEESDGRDKMIAESRVEGEVDKVLMAKVPVDSNRLFDGTFE